MVIGSAKQGNEVRGTERALAHIEKVAWIKPIEGADNIELIGVLGWVCIAKKGEFKENDICIYFEIDSKLPETEWSEFMRPKHFKVKTMKLGKFNVISQGLALPLSAFGWEQIENKVVVGKNIHPVGDDVTELLGVKYSVEEDNIRKSKNGDPNAKYKSMAARHQKLFKTKPFRWLMKRSWGRKLLFIFFGKKKDKPKAFPDWIVKTDETRCENIPWILGDTNKYVVTSKIDGTSSTYAIDFTKTKKGEFIVCSRNVRQQDEKQECYHDSNVYWEMAFKYNIEQALRDIAKQNNANRVVLQGETYGEGVQGNFYKIKGRNFAAFNLILDGNRMGSVEAKDILSKHNIPFVPILRIQEGIPETMEELKLEADGKSEINSLVIREGLVYRSLDGKNSFKNVSRLYLLKKGDRKSVV